MPALRRLLEDSRRFLLRQFGREPVPRPAVVPRVLALTAFEHDQRFFSKLHGTGEWDFTITASAQAAKHLLDNYEYALVICDRDIPGWEWPNLLELLKSHAPRACFLLSSRVNDSYLWKEVLRHGGYDLLPKPLDTVSSISALRRAFSYWQSNPPTL